LNDELYNKIKKSVYYSIYQSQRLLESVVNLIPGYFEAISNKKKLNKAINQAVFLEPFIEMLYK
jgi:hypothetical protein